MLTSSCASQLDPYRAHYPRKPLLVLDAGELRYRRPQTLARLYEFVGADAGFHPTQAVANPAEEHRRTRSTARVLARRRIYRGLLNRSWRMRRLHHRIGTRDVEAEVTPKLRQELASRLSDDVARLQDLVPGLPHWDL